MTTVRFKGRRIDCREDETVLEALLRHGEAPTFSCRSGSCHACLLRATSGSPPPRSQRTLRPALQQAGYFLPCVCVPSGDLDIEPPRESDLFTRVEVVEKDSIAPGVVRLRLAPHTNFEYRAGQCVRLRSAAGVVRTYSLASVPNEDPHLELHVAKLPGGELSSYIADVLTVGDELDIQGPFGHLTFDPGEGAEASRPLLLFGTGTGVAPLFGVLRDAMARGFSGPARLFVGARTADDLYLHQALRDLREAHPSIEVVACISRGPLTAPEHVRGRVTDVARARLGSFLGHRVYAAGLTAMVEAVESLARSDGLAAEDLHVDAFRPTATTVQGTARDEVAHGHRGDEEERPAPDPEMWRALDEGVRLNAILVDFYAQVFEDEVLSPYFRNVTPERVVGQVYSFLRDTFTGTRTFFGMRPRTAHHWMVIPDEIFDHREALMVATLRRHEVPEHLVQRWRAFEERFRGDIVKSVAWKLVVDGVEMPLDGFGEVELSVGSVCDGCQEEVHVGERVRYHLRLGTTYCRRCTSRFDSIRPAAVPS